MTDPFRSQESIDAYLRQVFESTEPPRLSDDFDERLAMRLREIPLPQRHATFESPESRRRRRWVMRLYWISAAVVGGMTIDATALTTSQLQAVAVAAAVCALMLQSILSPSSLGRVLRAALR